MESDDNSSSQGNSTANNSTDGGSDRSATDLYIPPPNASGSTTHCLHRTISHAFELARLNHRVRLFADRLRSFRTLHTRRRPADTSIVAPSIIILPLERNSKVPRLAALTARSRSNMQMDIDTPPTHTMSHETTRRSEERRFMESP